MLYVLTYVCLNCFLKTFLFYLQCDGKCHFSQMWNNRSGQSMSSLEQKSEMSMNSYCVYLNVVLPLLFLTSGFMLEWMICAGVLVTVKGVGLMIELSRIWALTVAKVNIIMWATLSAKQIPLPRIKCLGTEEHKYRANGYIIKNIFLRDWFEYISKCFRKC